MYVLPLLSGKILFGNQPIGGGCYGKSITDPCLGWKKTERLLLEMAEQL